MGCSGVGSNVGFLVNVGSSVGWPDGSGVGGVGSGVGGLHSGEYGSPSIHEHSSASMHINTSSILPQYDHVRGEFPVQHPGPNVGAGGIVADGGSVKTQSSGSSVVIHEHTPADSQSSPVSNVVQYEKVRGEYPVQHPSS